MSAEVAFSPVDAIGLCMVASAGYRDQIGASIGNGSLHVAAQLPCRPADTVFKRACRQWLDLFHSGYCHWSYVCT